MSEGPSGEPPLSPSRFFWLDTICNRFEAAWKAGQRPRIEDYLGEAEGDRRPELFRELLLLDVHYRNQRGASPSTADYLERFPEHAALIDEAFRLLFGAHIGTDRLWHKHLGQPPSGDSRRAKCLAITGQVGGRLARILMHLRLTDEWAW